MSASPIPPFVRLAMVWIVLQALSPAITVYADVDNEGAGSSAASPVEFASLTLAPIGHSPNNGDDWDNYGLSAPIMPPPFPLPEAGR